MVLRDDDLILVVLQKPAKKNQHFSFNSLRFTFNDEKRNLSLTLLLIEIMETAGDKFFTFSYAIRYFLLKFLSVFYAVAL